MAASPLDPGSLVADAEARTGLRDWDGDSFREHLDALATEIVESDPRPEALEHTARQWRLLLANRLRHVEHRHRHPEVTGEVVAAPLIVLGLPRTGSTALGGLLAQDPANRTIGPIEAQPFPGSGPDDEPMDLGGSRVVDDGLRRRHMIGPPPEDVHLFGYEFLGMSPNNSYDVPRYAARVLEHDATVAYAWHRRVLQYGQHRDRRERWSLRTPAHAYHLEDCLATYPDARIVCTHRDPVSVLGSITSLVSHNRAPNYDRVLDPVRFGAEQLELRAELVRRLLATRDARADASQFLDVRHGDVSSDPIGVVHAIYEHFGLDLPASTERVMASWVEANRHDRYQAEHGSHEYDLADYGLSAERVEREFPGYRERFGV